MAMLKSTLVSIGLWLMACATAGAGTVTYIYTDPQGTPLLEVDAAGSIKAGFDYRPYGALALGTAKDGPGFTGHVNDIDTNFVYMQARYYDPVIGRFLSSDPVSAAAGNGFSFNKYTYANNNPIHFIDPAGRSTEEVDGIGAGPEGNFGHFHYDDQGRKSYCEFCLSDTTKNAWGSNEVPIGSGYVGRRDAVPGTDFYEIHVYEDTGDFQRAVRSGNDLRAFEVGVVGPTGEWLNKHGHTEVPRLPGEVRNTIRGYVADMARSRGWLPEKGVANIKGSRLTSLIEAGMQETGSLRYLKNVGRALGAVGEGASIFSPSPDVACSNGTAQAGGLGEELCH